RWMEPLPDCSQSIAVLPASDMAMLAGVDANVPAATVVAVPNFPAGVATLVQIELFVSYQETAAWPLPSAAMRPPWESTPVAERRTGALQVREPRARLVTTT